MTNNNSSGMKRVVLFFAGIAVLVLMSRILKLEFVRALLAGVTWFVVFALVLLSSFTEEKRLKIEEDQKKSLESIERIRGVTHNIQEKSFALGESFKDEKALLGNIADSAAKFFPLNDVGASKAEYEILTKLTQVGFLCDKAIAGTDTAGDFKKQLASLVLLMKQREALSVGMNKKYALNWFPH